MIDQVGVVVVSAAHAAALCRVCFCSCRRRLNNNSLSGPFPASLAKIPQLSFLYVRNARTRLVEAIGFLPRFYTTVSFLFAAAFGSFLRFKSNSIRDSMRLVGVCYCSQGLVLQQPHWPRSALPDKDLQVSVLITARPHDDRLILMHIVTFAF